ncbi:MAG: CPBP family intramembrane metalloprotease [Planctomycetes bacterium]|nr:CPBP family intramembrane metalloprotease [Planctomycetota bacterium]
MNLTDQDTGKYLYKLLKVNNTQTRQRITFNCRWSIKDAIKVFFAYVILMFVGMPLIMQFVSTVFGHDFLRNIGPRNVILFVTLFINLSVCSYVFYIVHVECHQSITALGLSLVNLSNNIKQGIKKYLVTLPIIILAGFIINLISSYYGINPEMQDVVKWILEEKSLFILISLIFFGVIIAPLIEEIIFRGFLQSALKNYFGRRYAIVISASLFAAVHMDAFAFFQILILGILLGYLYEKTQTLVASVVIHILHNSFTLVFLLYFKYFLKGKVPVF